MQKKSKTNDEESTFEIIELAINDINILTKAFNVINAVCTELNTNSKQEGTSSVDLNDTSNKISTEHSINDDFEIDTEDFYIN